MLTCLIFAGLVIFINALHNILLLTTVGTANESYFIIRFKLLCMLP